VFYIYEVIDILVLSLILGFIFSGLFGERFKLKSIYYGFLVSAPAIILHEIAHKISAYLFGIENPIIYSACSSAYLFSGSSDFFSWYCIILIGAVTLKIFGFTPLFFIPAFVSFKTSSSPLVLAFIAFSGPLMNLLLWIISILLMKIDKFSKYHRIFEISAKINILLFIINILPLPGFDGWHILINILEHFA
jgi:Zn-dependent protease